MADSIKDKVLQTYNKLLSKINEKADKASPAIANNLAKLDASGNVVDSGIAVSVVGDIENALHVINTGESL